MEKKVAYIAGPYRAATPHGIVQNIRRAEAVAIKYWKKGYVVICPHKNSALFDGILSDEAWLEASCVLLARCDVCVMMQGWERSEGARNEESMARDNKMEIIYDDGQTAEKLA